LAARYEMEPGGGISSRSACFYSARIAGNSMQ